MPWYPHNHDDRYVKQASQLWDEVVENRMDKAATEAALAPLTVGTVYVAAGGNIQSAIDAAAGGKRVVLGPGVHDITTPLLMRAAHDRLHLEALVRGTAVLRIDDSAAAYASTSGNILEVDGRDPVYSETGRTDALPAGSTSVTLTDASGVSVGDLLLMCRDTVTTGNEGEIRQIIAISGTAITFDYPLYRDSLDGTAWTLEVYEPRSATIRGVVFDAAVHDAGHGGAFLQRLTGVLFEDCAFIGGGQHGAYVMQSHTVTYRRCHAENFDVRDAAWTPERSGETEIAAARASLAGEGYGLAFEAVNGLAEDCTFRRNRHHIAVGGWFYSSAHIVYRNCHGSEDLQGAFDFHYTADHCQIDPSCTASRGWAGPWIRGRDITVRGTYTDMAGNACRIHEECQGIDAEITADRCGYGYRVSPAVATARRLRLAGVLKSCTTMAVLTDAGVTYEDLDLSDLRVVGGKWQVRLEGTFRNLRLPRSWRGPHTYAGTGQDVAPVWIRADNAAGTVRGVIGKDITIDTGGSNIGQSIVLGKAAAAGTLAADTYADVDIDGVTIRTDGGSAQYPVAIDNDATISGREVYRNIRVNGSRAQYLTANSGTATIADGGTITHDLYRTPTRYGVTATVAGRIVAVTAVSSTTLTVAIKTDAGAAGGSQDVQWWAEV